MAAVTLNQITKRFDDNVAVQPMDLHIPDGSFTVLVGPSGCGKTTTLRMLAGLEASSGGEISIDDREVTGLDPKDRNVAMVFQNFALYPHINVERNIGFGLEARKLPRDQVKEKVRVAAQMLGIDDLLGRKPGQLSGGQQQRVAIARAIVREPSVFLFDEPLSNLDAKLRVETRTELLRLQRRLHATMVYVTHDQEEAMILADELIVMDAGRVVQAARPADVYKRPSTEFVARFIGSPEINLLDGDVRGGHFVSPVCSFKLLGVRQGPIRLGVRPDDVRFPAELPHDHAVGKFHASIEVIELLGPSAVLYLDVEGREFRAVVSDTQADDLHENDRIEVAFDRRRLHIFDPETGERMN